MPDAKFILWDRKDGDPRREESGEFISDGVIGRVTMDNCYLTAYANYGDDPRRPKDLAVGECIPQVRYSLSGEAGRYDLYRVS